MLSLWLRGAVTNFGWNSFRMLPQRNAVTHSSKTKIKKSQMQSILKLIMSDFERFYKQITETPSHLTFSVALQSNIFYIVYFTWQTHCVCVFIICIHIYKGKGEKLTTSTIACSKNAVFIAHLDLSVFQKQTSHVLKAVFIPFGVFSAKQHRHNVLELQSPSAEQRQVRFV